MSEENTKDPFNKGSQSTSGPLGGVSSMTGMNQRALTYGEMAVGLTFNPSNDPTVQAIKEKYAEIIDLCASKIVDKSTKNEQGDLMIEAIRHAQTAQMWAVKAVTWGFK